MSKSVIMDFPQAWDYVRSHPELEHDPKCSWVQTNEAMLCDCHVINDEYHRREISIAKGKGCWYKTTIYECPLCFGGQTIKERKTGPKPKEYHERYEYVESYDWCLP